MLKSLTNLVAVGMLTLTGFGASAAITPTDIIPAQGDVTSLDKVQLTFDERYEAPYQSNGTMITVTKDGMEYCGVQLAYSDFMMNAVEITLDQPATMAGEYQIVIPANTIELDDVQNDYERVLVDEEIILTYTVSGVSSDYTVIPGEGEVGNLGTIQIKFGQDYWIAEDQDKSDQVTVTKDGADFCGVSLYADLDNAENWTSVFVELDKPATEPGTYVVTIPAGTILNDVDYEYFDQEIVLTYNVTGAAAAVEPVSVYPEANSTIAIVNGYPENNITLMFPAGTTLNEGYEANFYPVDGSSSLDIYLPINDMTAMQAGTFIVPLGDCNEINENGEFVLYLDPGTFSLNGATNETITIHYFITGASTGGDTPGEGLQPLKVSPEPGSDLGPSTWLEGYLADNVTIEMPDGTSIVDGKKAVFASEDGSFSAEVSISDWSFLMSGTFIVMTSNMEGIQNDGPYTLTIPAGTFTLGGESNEEYVYHYNVTGFGGGSTPGEVEMTSAVYTDASIEPVTLEDNVELAQLAENGRITFNFVDDLQVGYVHLTVTDLNPLNPDEAIFNYEAHALRTLPEPRGVYWNDDEAPYVTFARSLELLKDHQYEFLIEWYDFETPPYSRTQLGSRTITVNGSSAPYEYSEVKYEGVTPDPETYEITSVEGGKFTISFDGPAYVNLAKSNFGASAQGASADMMSEENVAYSDDHKNITITFPESILLSSSGSVVANVYPVDADGRAIYCGTDTKADSYLSFNYACRLGSPDLVIAPEGGIVDSLLKIQISAPNEETSGIINYSDNALAGEITITDRSGDRVYATLPQSLAKVVETAEVYDAQSGAMVSQNIKWEYTVVPAGIDPADAAALEANVGLAEPGIYVLNIPSAYFSLGTEFTGVASKPTFVEYMIEGEVVDNTVYDFVPEKAEEMADDETSVAVQFLFTFPEDVYSNWDMLEDVVIVDADGNEVEDSSFDMEFDYENYNMVYAWAMYPKTTDVRYLVIPQGTFGDLEWSGEDGTQPNPYCQGHANPELRYEMKWGGAPVENVLYDFVPESDITVSTEADIAKAQVHLTFAGDVFPNERALFGMTFVDADGVEIADAEIEPLMSETDMTIVDFYITYPKTEKAYLRIPQGSFGDSDWWNSDYMMGHANPALEYEIKLEDDSVNRIAIDDMEGNDVYTITGIRVYKDATRDQLHQLQPGIYVIAGRKVLVK